MEQPFRNAFNLAQVGIVDILNRLECHEEEMKAVGSMAEIMANLAQLLEYIDPSNLAFAIRMEVWEG